MTASTRSTDSSRAPDIAAASAGNGRGLARAGGLTKGAIVGGTAVAALVAALVGLAFDLWPTLRPDPRTQLGADVRVRAIERNVSLGEFMRRKLGSEGAYRRWRARFVRENGAAGLAFQGEMVYVWLSVRGYKGRDVTLNWSVYDARTKARVRAPVETERRQSLASLEAPTDEFVAEQWIEPVYAPSRYFVRIEIRDGATLLAIADSEPFEGLRPPY